MDRILPATLVLFAGFGLGLSASGRGPTQEQNPTRTMLLKADVPGCPGREVAVWVTELAPGSRTPTHSHPGDVFGFVLQGSLGHTIASPGGASNSYRTGQAWHELPGEAHWGSNPDPAHPARLVAFGILEKNKPISIPVP